MATTTKHEIADLRAQIDAAAADAQLDAFVERNRDMLVQSVRAGRKFLAQGNYRVGTAAELVTDLIGKSRRRPKT
ncbi:hypothetical protein D3874_10985 [Oleomonas cavernae]|uniref:Uncharacterized protein n=1 Tax=Oleomonas cavernae TaxID=2320859 RepID=A0A418WBY8_9PROT|nr:hypothetical protein [Oleomonas cavernae]RJF87476.1 hypothetical protein D3874_10985 [Oleomonas cavernae]